MERKLVLVLAVLCAPVVLAVAGGGAAVAAPAPAAGDGGQAAQAPAAVFVAQKCNLCHSLASHDIARKTKSEKVAGPDLSAVGAEHDAAWIARWLRKEEKIDGKAHSKAFTGSPEELEALAKWLATLKDKAAVPAG
jgi:hypothetical protein